MRRFKKLIFWAHLILGLASGAVIAVVAFTGAMLAFEKDIIAWVERAHHEVSIPESTERLSLGEVLELAQVEHPDRTPSVLRLSADPASATTVSFGKRNTVYVNPYNGSVQRQGAESTREFFQLMLKWHRYLGVQPARGSKGKNQSADDSGIEWGKVTQSTVHIATIIFLFLCLSGLYLWWPRQWKRRIVERITRMRFDLKGKARDWNWHNAVGFWSLPFLIILCYTGIVIAYRDLRPLIYTPPKILASERPGKVPTEPQAGQKQVSVDTILEAVFEEAIDWETASLRISGSSGGGREAFVLVDEAGEVIRSRKAPKSEQGIILPQPAVVSIERAGSWSPIAESYHVDVYTGEIIYRERLGDYGLRRLLVTLNKDLHTGEAFGIPGKAVAFCACLGALLLVWTGAALSWRRFFKKRR